MFIFSFIFVTQCVIICVPFRCIIGGFWGVGSLARVIVRWFLFSKQIAFCLACGWMIRIVWLFIVFWFIFMIKDWFSLGGWSWILNVVDKDDFIFNFNLCARLVMFLIICCDWCLFFAVFTSHCLWYFFIFDLVPYY